MNMDWHPVQFLVNDPQDSLSACLVCGSLVWNSDKWHDLHRENHDNHNAVHKSISERAGRYVPPPRYR